MKYAYLSYPLAADIPVYGGRANVKLEKIKSIRGGDSSNISQFTIAGHWGTHAEGPNHFFDDGRRLADYPPEFWFFKYPEVIRPELKPSEILKCGDWIKNIKHQTDILFFRSGWSGLRRQEIYSFNNPGLDPGIGLTLRKKFPNIRAIAIDWISVSSYNNRALGREAHKAFLDPEGENSPIIIIEDADLSRDPAGIEKVCVFPLRVKGIDAAPCTIIGGFK